MRRNTLRISSAALSVAALVGLSACGGGGGGGGGGLPSPPPGGGSAPTSTAPAGFTFNPWPRDTVSVPDAGSRLTHRITDISSNSLGGWNVLYVLGGRPGSVHLSNADRTSTNQYVKDVGDLHLNLSFDTDSFDFFDVVSIFMNFDGDISNGRYIRGTPTGADANLSGSAVYSGMMSGYRYYIDPSRLAPNPADRGPEYEEIFGDLTLSVNFDSTVVTGSVDNVRIRPRGGALETHPGTHFSFSNGSIDQGSFTADFVGSGAVNGFSGDVVGAFYGPGADEVGGVVTASRGPNDAFLGHIGADR